jgi:lipoate-protein ligase B
MDLEPFERINPCGYAGLTVTDLAREAGVRRAGEDGARPAGSAVTVPAVAAVAQQFGEFLAEAIERP